MAIEAESCTIPGLELSLPQKAFTADVMRSHSIRRVTNDAPVAVPQTNELAPERMAPLATSTTCESSIKPTQDRFKCLDIIGHFASR
jgi:hypothetical protein